MIKHYFFILLFFVSLTVVTAQPPAGYYTPANGLQRTALQQALHDIIDNHNAVSYDYLWTAFETTDKKPNGKVWDMYSDIPGGTPPYEFTFGSDQCGSYNSESDCYNREHSWPKSWFSDKTPMYSDLFHLYPTDGYVNNRRSNYPYAKVASATWTSQNGSKLGSCATPGYTGTVFEPIDAYKGDFARSYFYMSTRYYNEDAGWAGSAMTNGSQLKPWALAMMLQWNDQDPVSQKEIDRNNAVYAIQQNRNPFIDHPEYAQMIWGTNAVIPEEPAGGSIEVYPNPAQTDCFVNLPTSLTGKKNPVILVYTITGKPVAAAVSFNGTIARIDLSDLHAGVYLIQLTSPENNSVFHSRIVKQ